MASRRHGCNAVVRPDWLAVHSSSVQLRSTGSAMVVVKVSLPYDCFEKKSLTERVTSLKRSSSIPSSMRSVPL